MASPVLWRADPNPVSFEWIDFNDRENTVLSYLRRDGLDHAIVIFNFTPVPRPNYRIGAPEAGKWLCVINSDNTKYGGSGCFPVEAYETTNEWSHGRTQSLVLNVPPLGALMLFPARLYPIPEDKSENGEPQ